MSLGQFEQENRSYTSHSWDEYMKYAHREYQQGGFPRQKQTFYSQKFYFYDPRTGRFTEQRMDMRMDDFEEFIRRQKTYQEYYKQNAYDFFNMRRDFFSWNRTPLFSNFLRMLHFALISFLVFTFFGFLAQITSRGESDRERLRNALKEKRKNPTPKDEN